MSNIAPISGVGKNAKRTDRGMVQKIQRNARIENAAGGTYGERKDMKSLASAESTGPTASAVSAQPAPRTAAVQVTGAFAPGSQGKPFTDGAGGNTAGATPDELMANYQSSDPGAILVRAMYKMYPTPELRRYVEAYNEEGLY
jgi:hypothetical protein